MKRLIIILLTIPWILLGLVFLIFKPRVVSTYSIPAYQSEPICSTIAVLDVRVPDWISRSLVYKIDFFTGGMKLEDGWHLQGNISRTEWNDSELCK